MAGTYVLGETKVRPGAYFNIQKKGTGQQSGTDRKSTRLNSSHRSQSRMPSSA